MSQEFTEQRFDYSLGREDAPELTIMVGLSGSGKSTTVKSWLNWAQGQSVRLNRDDMRKMLYDKQPWASHKDDLVRVLERDMARTALKRGKNVFIDDTNCVTRTRAGWQELARECRVKCRIVTMTVDLKTCVERDSTRGDACVGKDVILKQASDLKKFHMGTETKDVLTRPVFEKDSLLQGTWEVRLPGAKWVIFDLDGTLSDSSKNRNPYDESRVLEDGTYPVVFDWLRACYPHYNVLVMSGRKEKSGDDSCDWLEMHNGPFDHMLMRCTSDNRSDEFVKKDLLDMFVEFLPNGKDDILFVADDRPKVCRMWKANGLTCYPVRGAVEEF